MDSQKQPNDNRPLLKKLVLPITFFIGGLLIFVILYKFLLADKTNLPTGVDSQDAFQAPVEISPSLQIECQASVEKIDKLESCAEKESEFLAKVSTCAGYAFVLETAQSLATDGQFGDIAFNIASCYKKAGADKLPSAIALLKKVQSELPPWEVNMGPITCDSKSTLDAYLDSYAAQTAFTCTKSADLEKIVSQLQNKDLGFLAHFIWGDHIPELGLRDSDISCPESLNEITNSIAKALNKSSKVSVNNEGRTDTMTTYIQINKDSDLVAQLKVATNPDGCLYLDSLLVSNLDGVE